MDTPEAREAQRRQMWLDRGFDPDEEIKEYYDCFTLADAQTSLFAGTRYNPKPVYLTDSMVRLPVAIDVAKQVYLASALGMTEYPDWYFEGYILDFREPRSTRVRIHVTTDESPEFVSGDSFLWQKIPAKASSHSPLSGFEPEQSILKLKLNNRARVNLLRANGIETIQDLLDKWEDLNLIRGFGPVCRAYLIRGLREVGYNPPELPANHDY